MRLIERFFDRLGRSIALHPWPYIILPVIITFFCSFGLLRVRFEDDIWDIYSPLDSISRAEEKDIMPFEHASGLNHYRMTIVVDRSDHGNLLDLSNLEEIDQLNRFIARNHSIHHGGKNYYYRDICGVYCNDSNTALLGFLIGVVKKEEGGLMFTFPRASALQQEFYIGRSIGDFRRNDRNVIDDFRLLFLYYAVEARTLLGKDIARQFETDLQGIFKRATEHSLSLNFEMMSKNREQEEQRAMLTTVMPYLIVTTAILLCFTVGTLIDFPLVKSQHIEALCGLLTPTMAIVTSMGFLFFLGFPFSNVLIVVPFLVNCIGVDDAFLILAAWRQSDPDANLVERMAYTMAKSGASVSVTSFTDVLCFAVGFCSQLPVVRLFCLYTALCLALDYIYQITIFSAIVALRGKRQLRILDEQKKSERLMTLGTKSEQIRTHCKRSSQDSGVVVVFHTAKREESTRFDKKLCPNTSGDAATQKRAKFPFSSLFAPAKVAPFQSGATRILCGQSMDDVRKDGSLR
uniref:SSD domain-containing protein n=1 Tax=Plectus sambesii TaxID=2011161 RepID=A0A914VWU1_9BILA